MRSRKSAISLNTREVQCWVEYPDREEMRKIARKVYGDLNERGDIPMNTRYPVRRLQL